MKSKLTDRYVDSLKSEDGKRLEVLDTQVGGLHLRVGSDGSKKWSVRATGPTGKKIRAPLGEYPTTKVAIARAEAGKMKERIRKGYDPIQAKQEAQASAQADEDAITLGEGLDLYDTVKLSGLRTGYATKRDLKRDFAKLLKMKAHTITSKQIADIIDTKAKKSPVMARRLHAYGRAWFKWLAARQHIEGNPFDVLEAPGKEKARERVLSPTEVGAVWNACGKIGGLFVHCIRVQLLTGQRREEVAGMHRDELDLENKTWIVPADRSKTGRALKVPLPDKAISEIEAAITKSGGGDLVFSTTGKTPISGFSRAKVRLDTATQKLLDETAVERGDKPKPMPGWRLHDFRRTMVSTMADMGIDPTVADRCLNHKAAATMSTVQRVYQQSDLFEQRKHATNAWATKVLEWAGVETADNVLPYDRSTTA
ncbi:MAG: tyrosine-type recombinase/integrase [Rhodospirillales bacterium]|nr:tyrosine-type recombinase/integrase [Rhodospirillales bacterium]